MFTSNNFKVLVLVTNLGWFTGTAPFHFVKHQNGDRQLVSSKARGRSLFFGTSFFMNTSYICFIAFRLFQKVFSAEPMPLSFLVKMGYLFLSYSMSVVLQTNTLLTWEGTPRFYGQYIDFFKNIQGKYMLPSEKGSKCMKFFSGVIFIGTAITTQNIAILFRKPSQDHLLTSLLENPKNTSIVMKLPFIIPQMWIWACCWTNIWVFCFNFYLYITCGVFVMKEVDIRLKHGKARTMRQLREAKTCAQVIRSMQVLHRIWQINFQEWFCPTHKAAAVSVATLSLYGVIKLSGPRALIMGFVAALCLMYLSTQFYKAGKFNEISKATLENWKNSPSASRWMKKFIASVPIFSVGIGQFYYVKKTTVIMVMWTVMNNTITLLFL